MNSVNFSSDDFPVMNAYIDSDCLNEFYETVIDHNEHYRKFSAGEFLKRSYVFSGKYLTFAGALMFGNIMRVKATLAVGARHVAIEAVNIWEAYNDLLPRLTSKLSFRCREKFREIFVNALLYSDYSIDNVINITILPQPPRALIEYPGTIDSRIKNYRLQKIFELSGIIRANNERTHENLEQDILNFRVRATIKLEGISQLPLPKIL